MNEPFDLKRFAVGIAIVAVSLSILIFVTRSAKSVPVQMPEGGTQFDDETWANPIGAPEVASLADARLGYRARDPRLPARPVRVVATGNFESPLNRMIAWVFDDPNVGRYFVLEEVVPGGKRSEEVLLEPANHTSGCVTSNADAEAFGEGATMTNCHGEGFSESSVNGHRALVVNGESAVSVTWLEPVNVDTPGADPSFGNAPLLQIKVMGPAHELTVEEALAIAESV